LLENISNQEKITQWEKEKGACYVGFDPSAKSLHLGNYVTLSVIKRLRKAGHPVYGIVGGITGLIGDPRDPKLTKSAVTERLLKTKEEIAQNTIAIGEQLKKYADATDIVNNISFYEDMKV
jgi:tyrosyl-tRNA synthetase